MNNRTRRLVYGIQAVSRLLHMGAAHLECVYLQQDLGKTRLGRIMPLLESCSVKVIGCSASDLERKTGTPKHQGVAAVTCTAPVMNERQAKEYLGNLTQPLILVLDGIEDPRNFGACLRTADAAGVDLVVLGRSRTVSITPVVSKVAVGAAEVQPIAEVGNLARFLAYLQDIGVWVVGTDEAGDKLLFDADLTGSLAIVMGAEGQGLRRLTKERCDFLVRLPMQGVVESLNISVAAGICLYECLRQRSA